MDGFSERREVRVGARRDLGPRGYAGGDTKEGKWLDVVTAGSLDRVASRLQQNGQGWRGLFARQAPRFNQAFDRFRSTRHTSPCERGVGFCICGSRYSIAAAWSAAKPGTYRFHAYTVRHAVSWGAVAGFYRPRR